MRDRINYWRRIFKVYFSKSPSYLTFWHERPALSDGVDPSKLGVYYMTFRDKADYAGPKDEKGAILFDYFGDIGRQYNPLAVAQYGLANLNIYLETGDNDRLEIARIQSEWLVENLEKNDFGLPVWKHKFRWRYRHYLAPGWYSAHSQGTGISLLARMYKETDDIRYLNAAKTAFPALAAEIGSGGVKWAGADGDVWLEEYIVDPPTHILNGFVWGLWGVWDYYLLTNDAVAYRLFDECVLSLKKNLFKYDCGFWSLYDLSEQHLKMVTSLFYHDLHIVQLKVMAALTGDDFFDHWADKWSGYRRNVIFRAGALVYKVIFKLFYF
jgi:heparosan-N-sulfate-glucuronate 5-epimerase